MTLLEKVKANLILEHDADDGLVQAYIFAVLAIVYIASATRAHSHRSPEVQGAD